MEERLSTTAILARNLDHLMKDRGWTQVETAKRARVDQKTISNILNQKKTPGLEVVESIATAFGLNLWHLILPSLIDDLNGGGSIRAVYDAYFKASREGRQHIIQVAEREAEYNKKAS